MKKIFTYCWLLLLGLTGLAQNNKAPLCPATRTVSANETHSVYAYIASSWVTSTSNYTVNSGQNITFSATNYVQMNPNTLIKPGAVFVAEIGGCEPFFKQPENPVAALKPTARKLVVSPNPALDMITIATRNTVIGNLTITSLDGKLLFAKTIPDATIFHLDISGYTEGVYVLSIESGGEIQTQKIIKK
jgi:type IX secretion system substrate protein